MAQFSCKLSCDPKLWNARESRLNGKSREAVATNGKLERLLLSVQSAYRVLCERGVVFTATDIKEQFQGSMQTQITFLERYDRMVEEMEQKVGIEIKAATMSSYHTCSEASASLYWREVPYDRHSFRSDRRRFLGMLATLLCRKVGTFARSLPNYGVSREESLPFGVS